MAEVAPRERPQTDFTVRFTGDLTSVRANTLTEALVNSATALHGINDVLYSDQTIEVYISAPERSSFEFVLELAGLTLGTASLFGPEGINSLVQIVEVFSDSLDLLRHLGGEEPRSIEPEGDFIKIENRNGNVTYVDKRVQHIYRNEPRVPEALGDTFEALEDESEIEGMEIERTEEETGERTTMFRANRDEFRDISRSSKLAQPDTTIETIEAQLYPTSWDTNDNRQWSALYHGYEINLYITDEVLYNNINSYRFGLGDRMDVTLDIHKEYDPEIGTYKNKRYEVTRVHQYHERPPDEQGHLFPRPNPEKPDDEAK